MKKFFKLSGSKSKDDGDVTSSPNYGRSPRSSVSSTWGSVLKLPFFNEVHGNAYLVDLGNKSFTKLHKACWSGTLEKVKKHVKKVDVNQADYDNRTPLHLAAANAHKNVVWFLLGCKARPNPVDSDGNTPLLKAILCYHDEIVQFLLDRGANPKVGDRNGNTALHLVAKDGRQDLAVALIQKGIDINAQNKDGFSPLMVAAQHRQLEMAELLIRHGASVNILDKALRNCLMVACESGDAGLARLFLDHGISVTATDAEGLTAEQLAREANQQSCLQIVRDFADMNELLGSSAESAAGFRRASRTASDLPESEKLVIGESAADTQDDVSRNSAVDLDADFDDDEPVSWNDDPSEEINPPRKVSTSQRFDLSKFLPESDQSLSEASIENNCAVKRSISNPAPVYVSDSIAEKNADHVSLKESEPPENVDSDNDATFNSDVLAGGLEEPDGGKVPGENVSVAAVRDRGLLADLGLDEDDVSMGSTESDGDMSAHAVTLRNSDGRVSPSAKSHEYTYVPSAIRTPSAPDQVTTSSAIGASGMDSNCVDGSVAGNQRAETLSLHSISSSPVKPPRLFKKNSAPGLGQSKSFRRTSHLENFLAEDRPFNSKATGSPPDRSEHQRETKDVDSWSDSEVDLSPPRNRIDAEQPRRDSNLTRDQNLGSLQTVYVSVRQDGQFGPGTDESDWGDEEDSSADNAATIHLRPVVLRKPSLETEASAPPPSFSLSDSAVVKKTEEQNESGELENESDVKDGEEMADPCKTEELDGLEVDKREAGMVDNSSQPVTPRSQPLSKSEGTLGRYGTLQEVEEVWETNALLEVSPASTLSSNDGVKDGVGRDARMLEVDNELYHADLVLLSSGSSAVSSRQQTLGRDCKVDPEQEDENHCTPVHTTAAIVTADHEASSRQLTAILDADELWVKLWQHIGLPRPLHNVDDGNSNDDSSASVSLHLDSDNKEGSSTKGSPTIHEAGSTDQSHSSVSARQEELGNMFLCQAVKNPDNAAHVVELIRRLQSSWQKEAIKRKTSNRRLRQISTDWRDSQTKHRITCQKLVESEGMVSQLASQLGSLGHDLSGETSRREEAELQLTRSKSQLQTIEESYLSEIEKHQRSDVEVSKYRLEATAVSEMLEELRSAQRSMSDVEIQTDVTSGDQDDTAQMVDSEIQTVDLSIDAKLKTPAVTDAEIQTSESDTGETTRLTEALAISKDEHNAELKLVTDRLADLSDLLEREKNHKDGAVLERVAAQEQSTALSFKLLECEKRLSDVQGQLTSAVSQFDQHSSEREEKQRAEFLAKLAASEERCRSLSGELMTARCRIEELILQASLLQSECQTRESTSRHLESAASSRDGELVQLKESVVRLQDELSSAKSDSLMAKLKLESSEKLLALRQQSEESIKASWEEVATSIRQGYNDVEKQLKEQNRLLQERCSRMQHELAASIENTFRLEKDLESATLTTGELSVQLGEMRSSCENFIKASEEAEQNCLTEKVNCGRLMEQLERRDNEIVDLRAELDDFQKLRLQLASANRDSIDARRLYGEVIRVAKLQDDYFDRLSEKDAALQDANVRLERMDMSIAALRDNVLAERKARLVVPELEKLLKEAQDQLQESKNEVSLLADQLASKDEVVHDLLAKLDASQKVVDELRLTRTRDIMQDDYQKQSEEDLSGFPQRSLSDGVQWRFGNSRSDNHFELGTADPPCNVDFGIGGGSNRVMFNNNTTRDDSSGWVTGVDQTNAAPAGPTDRIAKLEETLVYLQDCIEGLKHQPRQVYREPAKASPFNGGFPHDVGARRIGGITDSPLEELYRRMDSLQRELSDERSQRVAKETNLERQLVEARGLLERARQLQEGRRRSVDLSARSDDHKGCVDRAEVELLRQQWEIRSRLEFNESIGQIKKFLEEQSRTSDRLEQLHTLSETKLRREYQQALIDLQQEVGRLQESLSAKEMRQGALEEQYLHLSQLVEARRRVKGKLQEQQQKARGRSSSTPYRRYALTSAPPASPVVTSTPGCTTYPMSTSSVLSSKHVIPNNNNSNYKRAALTAKFDNLLDHKLRLELDRSVSQHLATGNLPDTVNSFTRRYGTTNIDLPHEKAAESYLKTLKRNYLL